MAEHEQERIDRLLREALSGPAPRLSSGFEARLAGRLRPRGLTPGARLLLVLYTVLAAVITIWATRDLPGLGDWLVPCLFLVLVPLSFAWTLRRIERPSRTVR